MRSSEVYSVYNQESSSKHLFNREQKMSESMSENVSDQNITAFIESVLGSSHINFPTLIPLTIIYSIFLVVGVGGNLFTCIVIICNEYMRTPTNIFLLNLAIVDIATLIISKY